MILQCDQCNTKFRLDDSKLKPGGVKVRCSKCRHVFVAGAEQKTEESDFDALLSGLGAPAPSQGEEAPVAAQAGSELAGLEFGAESAKPQEDVLAGFEPGPELPAAPTPQVPAEESGGAGDFDFGDINLETGTPAGKEAPASAPDETGFAEFEFSEESVTPAPKAPAATDLGFGELSFDETPAAPKEEATPAAADFGDLSFEEPPAAAREEAQAAADVMDFGEFSFEETPAAAKEEAAPAAAPAGDAFDFGEFSFEETPAAAREEVASEPAAEDADFGEFSFEETPAAAKEEAAPAAAAESLDFGDFSFEEAAAPAKEEPPPATAADSFDFGDFSFEEPAPSEKEEPAGEAGAFSFEEKAPAEEPAAPAGYEFVPPAPSGEEPKQEVRAAGQDEEFSFGDFSFPEEPRPEASGKDVAPAAAGLAGGAALPGVAPAKGGEEAEAPAPEAAAKPAAKSALDFSFGDKPFAASVPEEGFDEELPPLSISSRRKGRSVLTIVVVAISMVVVLALTGAGLYLLQSGPDALKKLDQLGIGFVAKWFGMEVPEEGRITIKNPLASFHQNTEAGELFVVTGEAVNSFRKARASIQVKVSIFDKSGKVLLQKTAYCGNRLSAEQLGTLPMAKIESIMNNQFGDSLSNLGVKPDQSIGFVVAVANVPKEAADFGVEVVGSTVAAGQ